MIVVRRIQMPKTRKIRVGRVKLGGGPRAMRLGHLRLEGERAVSGSATAGRPAGTPGGRTWERE